LGAVCASTIGVGARDLGIEPDRFRIVGDCMVVIPLGAVRDTAIIVGDRVLGIEPYGVAVLDDGVVIVALGAIREAAGECILRIEPAPLPGITSNALELARQKMFYILAPSHLGIGGSKAALPFAFADERACQNKCITQIRRTAQRSVEKG